MTEQQVQALESAGAAPPRVVNPRTPEKFVLLPLKEYERLTEEEYDDSPWTREELEALAWERVKQEDGDEYDDPPPPLDYAGLARDHPSRCGGRRTGSRENWRCGG